MSDTANDRGLAQLGDESDWALPEAAQTAEEPEQDGARPSYFHVRWLGDPD